MLEVQAQEAVVDHAQQDQHEPAPDHVRVELAPRVTALDATGQREGHGDAGGEQEEREDQVPERETVPLDVMRLRLHPVEQAPIRRLRQRGQEPAPADDPEHVEAAQSVEGA